MKRHRDLALAFCLTLMGLAGCGAAVTSPEPELALASSAIGRAADAGADETATAELQAARDKLSRAEQAMERQQFRNARLLAEEALVDARLAEVRAQTVKTRKAATDLEGNIRLLREKILPARP